MILGQRRWIRTSIDPVELESLLHIRRFGVVTVVLAVTSFTVSGFLPGWWPATLVFVLFLAAIGWQQKVMLPRTVAGRLAREREIDPDTARRQLRQRRLAWLGMVRGRLMGGAGLVTGLISTTRIGLGS